jgi:hypothetical protein
MHQIVMGKTYKPPKQVELFKEWNKSLNNTELEYNMKVIIANNANDFSPKEKIILIRSLLAEMKSKQLSESSIRDIELWFHIEMANLIYKGHLPNYKDKAAPSLEFIEKNYLLADSNETRIIDLAEYFIAFEGYDKSKALLQPLIETDVPNKRALKLYVKHCMQYEQENFPATFTIYLKKAHQVLSKNEWCDLFIGPCKIPLEVFEWPALKSLYYQSCHFQINTSVEQ